MIYPKFIKKGGTIGITAPSAGIGHKLDEYIESTKVFKKEGYKIKETKSLRVNNKRSASARQRAKELDELVVDKNVDVVSCVTGGDYMYEIVPYINFEHIKENPKWYMGMSDPTNLLYLVTTTCDIATIYGHNGGSFKKDHENAKRICLDYMKGDIKTQKSFKTYQDFIDTCNDLNKFDKKVKWISKKDVNVEGRLIGGCLDVLRVIIGTKQDHTKEFLEKYKKDGFIWYFDVFAMTVLDFYLTLLQFKNAGYLDNCKAVLISRVAFPNIEDPKFDYVKAADLALGTIPHISEMDIGHTESGLTLINGAIAKVTCKKNKGSISFKLK